MLCFIRALPLHTSLWLLSMPCATPLCKEIMFCWFGLLFILCAFIVLFFKFILGVQPVMLISYSWLFGEYSWSGSGNLCSPKEPGLFNANPDMLSARQAPRSLYYLWIVLFIKLYPAVLRDYYCLCPLKLLPVLLGILYSIVFSDI